MSITVNYASGKDFTEDDYKKFESFLNDTFVELSPDTLIVLRSQINQKIQYIIHTKITEANTTAKQLFEYCDMIERGDKENATGLCPK